MTHSLTATRTITTLSTSEVLINTGYLKTWPGIFKLLQVILGTINVGLLGNYYNNYHDLITGSTFFFFMAVAFLIYSLLILLSCFVSISTDFIQAKNIFEVIYHGVAFILYLAASLMLMVEIHISSIFSYYEELFAVGVIGLVVSVLYLLSAICDYRSYKEYVHIQYITVT